VTPEQLDHLAEVGNKALNDYHHEDLCNCQNWPEKCRNYQAGNWDTRAFAIALPAIIAAYEKTRGRQ
jgi:hypothetical protein